jgi:hypothetical protein
VRREFQGALKEFLSHKAPHPAPSLVVTAPGPLPISAGPFEAP